MGSPCLFTRQQALKIGYFYWLRPEVRQVKMVLLDHLTKFSFEWLWTTEDNAIKVHTRANKNEASVKAF